MLKPLTVADIQPLAWALTDICRTYWNSDSLRAVAAADLLAHLNTQFNQPELNALAAWTRGIAKLAHGQMEAALTHFDQAAAQFQACQQPQTAAATQIGRLLALSMMGRYDEAIATGLAARVTFLAANDQAAAGRVELNLGNIYDQRDQYAEAEQFFYAAHERFVSVDDQLYLLQADIGLANVRSQQRQVHAAAALYEQVLVRATQLQATRTQAIVERNLGSLSLDRGQYAEALRYLEQSRRRYAQLDLPHEEALAERELADVYLELNLIPEAIAIYTSLAPVLATLKMSFERAWTLAHHGRATLLAGQFETARPLLAEARELFQAEHNGICVAFVLMLEAQRLYGQTDYAAAAPVASEAAQLLSQGGPLSWLIFAQWLAGDAYRLMEDTAIAESMLQTAHDLAQQHALPQVAYRCATSLGLLALKQGNRAAAIATFTQAVTLIETLRSPLPADDFRTAFFADKRTPYIELARLCLDDATPAQTIAAFRYVEQARARALTDLLSGETARNDSPSDSATSALQDSRAAYRTELNWIYSQITRAFAEDDPDRLHHLDTLQEQARRCEEAILTLTRQIGQYGEQSAADHTAMASEVALLDVAAFQRTLAPGITLVSYIAVDDELVAFIVTNQTVQAVRQLGSMATVRAAVEQVRFQMDTFRHGAARMHGHTRQLKRRVERYLGQLYDSLIRPLEPLLCGERVVFVPHEVMHYIPFAALYDGSHYLIERYEISLTPGMGVLQHNWGQPPIPVHRTLLVGVPDEHAPQVRAEVEHLADVLPTATVLLEQQATLERVQAQFEHADVLHLACHGHFRPDNPLFSALRLADGWLTVQDMETVRLHCRLVTLSACETGVSAIAPGDELLGLVRGFLSAGAQNLLVSLWTVDDKATTHLMQTFYRCFCAGEHPATALRVAQRAMLVEYPHPFFWSPFVLLGREQH